MLKTTVLHFALPVLSGVLLFFNPNFSHAETALTQLSIEELMQVEVTSVSKKQEKRVDVPAAITVITGEDIRRLGATSIPEALRLAPGLHVGRVSSSAWAVGSRGFSSLNSAKLLVLIDGRSVYTPLFSGVFWDVQDTVLEDIDRIEVIRGPGAAMWGANAMNGVINIITKNSKETQGALVEGGGGTYEHGFATLRYGGKWAENAYYRLYGKFFERDAGYLSGGGKATDDWRMGRMGLRTDWDLSSADRLTFQSDFYWGGVGQTAPSIEVIGRPGAMPPLEVKLAGGNGMASWRHAFDQGSELLLRFYYDRTHRNDPSYVDDLDTYDLEFQHRLQLPWQQELIYGAGFRLMSNENRGKGLLEFSSPRSTDRIFNGYIQDQLTFVDPSLRFTLGSKFEQNDFSGFEVQPSARVAWHPAEGHTLWAAVSRAVRVPTRLERDVDIDAADPATANPLPRLVGNTGLSSEKMTSYEIGYRLPFAKRLFVDVATFFNRYSNLLNLEVGTPFTGSTGTTIIPVQNQNTMVGNARGAEIAATYERDKSWSLSASYSHLRLQLRPLGSDINGAIRFTGATPAHQTQLMANYSFSEHLELNVFLRYVGSLRSSAELSGGGAPDYASMDLRFAWRAYEGAVISVVGQNLFQSRHLEFSGNGTQVERSVYSKFTLRF